MNNKKYSNQSALVSIHPWIRLISPPPRRSLTSLPIPSQRQRAVARLAQHQRDTIANLGQDTAAIHPAFQAARLLSGVYPRGPGGLGA